jgi:hypothetical protein
MRYPLSATTGSSGSGLYDTETRCPVGMQTRPESDPICVIPERNKSVTSPGNRTATIALTSLDFEEFARNVIVPHVIRIGTPTALKIATEWTEIAKG